MNVRPFEIYGLLYPLTPERVARLAYFFEYEYTDGRKPEEYVARTLDRVKTWKANKSGDLVKQYGESPELMVIDTRPERPQMMYPFNGIQREIYDYCDEIRTRGSISNSSNAAIRRERSARAVARSVSRPAARLAIDGAGRQSVPERGGAARAVSTRESRMLIINEGTPPLRRRTRRLPSQPGAKPHLARRAAARAGAAGRAS